jgi:hypothetical protein
MEYTYTNQAQVRAAFWRDNPNAQRRKITDYSGKGKMYCTDTRVLFCDWLDALQRNGEISPELVQRVTL